MSLTAADYKKCAHKISKALRLQTGESVLLKIDVRIFTEIINPLQKEIRKAGAFISGTILSEETAETFEGELSSIERLFDAADVFIWLPEMHQGSTPAVRQALDKWLDAKRGRSVHFHWGSGTYSIPGTMPPAQNIIDRHYLKALDVSTTELEAMHDRAIEVLRSGPVQVTTPEGTDLTFAVGDRPFTKQTGDASLKTARTWILRIDRDVELPSGVLRVAPIETSANGSLFLSTWKHLGIESNELLLRFIDGEVVDIQGKNAAAIESSLTEAGGAAKTFREFGLGCNRSLAITPTLPYIGYYGYGAGVVRLSLGDNLEMGGTNRGGGVYWNFITNATVTVGDTTLVDSGILL